MSTPPPKAGGGLFTPRNIIIALVVLLFLCCCCGVAGLFIANRIQQGASSVISDLSTLVPEQGRIGLVGADFMTKLKAADWAGAYALCTPTLQNDLGSAAGLSKRITDGKVQPVSWTFTDFGSVTSTSQDAQIDGTTDFSGGRKGTLRLVLNRVGAGWQISGFILKPN